MLIWKHISPWGLFWGSGVLGLLSQMIFIRRRTGRILSTMTSDFYSELFEDFKDSRWQKNLTSRSIEKLLRSLWTQQMASLTQTPRCCPGLSSYVQFWLLQKPLNGPWSEIHLFRRCFQSQNSLLHPESSREGQSLKGAFLIIII